MRCCYRYLPTRSADFAAGRNMLGLPLSTLVTGALFVALLAMWNEPAASKVVHADT